MRGVDKMEKPICPKCGKPGIKLSFYGGPDRLGIVGLIVHTEKMVQPMFGPAYPMPDEKCFLTVEEFNKAYGKPRVKCENCKSNGNAGCDYCLKFNNRPNFREIQRTDEKCIECGGMMEKVTYTVGRGTEYQYDENYLHCLVCGCERDIY